eukprot:g9231.t1 g9231   contig36:162528-164371(+)
MYFTSGWRQDTRNTNVHPIQHHARTLEIFRFMDAVPGIAPQADEATKKKWLFKSYPLKFRDEYHTSGRSLTTDTMLQVTTFMKKLYEIEERNRRIAGRKRGRSPSNYRGGGSKRQRNCGGESNNSRDSHNDGGRSNNGNNNKQRHSRKGNNHGHGGKHNDHRNDNNRNKSRVQDDEKCPLHPNLEPGHTWLECRQNQYGPNFRPKSDSKGRPMNTEAANATTKMQRTADGLHAESYDLMQQDEESEEISNNIKSIVEHVNEVDDTNLSTFPETDCDASKDGDASAEIANGDASDNGEDDIGMIDMLAFEPIIYQVPTPKQLQSQSKDIVPATLMIAQKVQGQQCPRLLKVLLDSGGGATLFHRSCLPRGATPRMLPEKKEMKTILGTFIPNNEVLLEDIQLPEFDKSRKVDFVNAFIFDEPCRYDVILGRDFLSKAGITICFKSNVMTWLENVVPMRCPTTDKETLEAVLDACYMHDEEYELEIDWLDGYLSNPIPILDAKYEKADIDEVTTMQKHLTKEQQRELATLLRKHEKLFNGTLGLYPQESSHRRGAKRKTSTLTSLSDSESPIGNIQT